MTSFLATSHSLFILNVPFLFPFKVGWKENCPERFALTVCRVDLGGMSAVVFLCPSVEAESLRTCEQA